MSKNKMLKESLSVLEELLELEVKYYGKFHLNIGKSLELKGKLLYSIGESRKAIIYLEQAARIYIEMNDKEGTNIVNSKILEICNSIK